MKTNQTILKNLIFFAFSYKSGNAGTAWAVWAVFGPLGFGSSEAFKGLKCIVQYKFFYCLWASYSTFKYLFQTLDSDSSTHESDKI